MTVISGQTLFAMSIFDPTCARDHHLGSGLTFGAGPAGYDVRIAEMLVLMPGQFELGSTFEHIAMPDDMVAIVHDKSTWARQGLALQNTVVEPGWRGFLTLELSNHGQEALVIPAGIPIAQLIFHRVEGHVIPYDGRYQDQEAGPQPARFR